MERVCFLLRVRADRLDEYRERHRAVWPEMLDALRATGWANYSLFLRDDGLLVGYLETEDFEAAVAGMDATGVNARWQAEMAEFFEQGPAAGFERLEEVFHLA
jgi:L-rhamnose mutarotase